jgi:hypothetical protein
VLAEVFLREADRLAPGDLRVSLDLARCGLLSTNAVTRAVALERLDSLSRSSAVQEEAARVLAFHLTRTGDPRAEAAWGRLLEVNPNDWEASLFRAMVITRTNAAAAVWQRPWSEAKSDRIRADVIRAMAVTAGPLTALEFLEQTQAGKSTSAAPLALGRLELEGSLKRWREVSAGAEQVVKRADATAEERFIGQLWRAVASRELGQASAYDESLQAALSMVRGNPSQALQGAFWLERAGHAEAADPFFALAAESPDRAVRVQALRRMVQRAAQRDNPVATESAARQLLAIQPDDSLGQILLVSSLIAQPAKRDQGEQRARRLSADRPEWTAMRLLCLQAMMMRGPSGDLMQQFQDADKLVYTSAVDRIVMARAAVMCRRFDRAEAWLTGVDPARLPTVHQETVRQLRQQIAAEAKPAGA